MTNEELIRRINELHYQLVESEELKATIEIDDSLLDDRVRYYAGNGVVTPTLYKIADITPPDNQKQITITVNSDGYDSLLNRLLKQTVDKNK